LQVLCHTAGAARLPRDLPVFANKSAAFGVAGVRDRKLQCKQLRKSRSETAVTIALRFADLGVQSAVHRGFSPKLPLLYHGWSLLFLNSKV
jgi:hypothetical protein